MNILQQHMAHKLRQRANMVTTKMNAFHQHCVQITGVTEEIERTQNDIFSVVRLEGELEAILENYRNNIPIIDLTIDEVPVHEHNNEREDFSSASSSSASDSHSGYSLTPDQTSAMEEAYFERHPSFYSSESTCGEYSFSTDTEVTMTELTDTDLEEMLSYDSDEDMEFQYASFITEWLEQPPLDLHEQLLFPNPGPSRMSS